MLYYLVKYRHISAFIIGAIIGLIIVIPVDIGLAYISLFVAIGTTIFASIHYDIVGYKLICNNLKVILKKYANKAKYFNFFYMEYVSSNAIYMAKSIMKKYVEVDVERKRQNLYTKLSEYKSFCRRSIASSYEEAIDVLSICSLFDEHLVLLNEVFKNQNVIDIALLKVLNKKEDKLTKILEEELVKKLKDLKRFGDYYI